jgi:hypothetical protein
VRHSSTLLERGNNSGSYARRRIAIKIVPTDRQNDDVGIAECGSHLPLCEELLDVVRTRPIDPEIQDRFRSNTCFAQFDIESARNPRPLFIAGTARHGIADHDHAKRSVIEVPARIGELFEVRGTTIRSADEHYAGDDRNPRHDEDHSPHERSYGSLPFGFRWRAYLA